MNNFSGIGRLGKDPELKTTNSGKDYCRFSLAIDRQFKNKDGERETDWLDCVAWGSTAKFIADYFAKGRTIGVFGSVQKRSWEGEDGQKRYATEIIVEKAYFTGQAKMGDAYEPDQTPPSKQDQRPDYDSIYGRSTPASAPAPAEPQQASMDDFQMPFDL